MTNKNSLPIETLNKHYLKFHRTNQHFYVQIITGENVIISSSTLATNLKKKIDNDRLSLMNSISLVANDLISKLKTKGIDSIWICTKGYRYHGKIRTFLEQLKKSEIKVY